ncbi:hypothetical protein N0V92_008739 [Colletotrichum tropicale]|nr:hypothetical protein N0V92_008739 [Colletotrichum tropicale]
MSKKIPILRDRRDFPAWQKAVKDSLTPFEWETITWTEGGPFDNLSHCLLWEKARAQAYNTIIQSIPNFILFGLGAHDELNGLRDFFFAEVDTVEKMPGGCPKELYEVICKWFNPSRAMIAAQIRCIANADPAKFQSAGQFTARMWLSKVCIDLCPDEVNPAVEMLLYDAIKDSHPAVVAELAAGGYTWTFSWVLHSISPEDSAWEPRSRPAERKRVADDTSRETKRVKTEPEEEACDVTVGPQTGEAST